MIEIVCKNGLQEEEKKLCLPKNIRQVGSPRGRHKIYIEDYVYTYLKAAAQKRESCAVVFLGKSQVAKEIRYTFVSGAVECGPGVFQWDSICLDENFWSHIEGEKQRYFPEKEIVGWFLGKTGQAMELAPVVEAAHRKYFPGRDKILMLMDILEQEEVFFIYDQGYLQKREGYYIYYEKNLPMQEYMVQKKEEDAGEQAEGSGGLPAQENGKLPEAQDDEGIAGKPEMEEPQPDSPSQPGKPAGSGTEDASQLNGEANAQPEGDANQQGASSRNQGGAGDGQPEGTAPESLGQPGAPEYAPELAGADAAGQPEAGIPGAAGLLEQVKAASGRKARHKTAAGRNSPEARAGKRSGAEAKARAKAGTRARIETGEGVKEYLELKKEFQELHKELEKEIPTGSPEKIFAKNNLEEPKTQAEEALESYRHMILERQGRQIARQNRKFLYTASSFFLVAVCVLGITTINNYRKMQEVEDVLHIMSGKTSDGKRAEGEDGPVVESVMSEVEPLEENGEGQPAGSGQGTDKAEPGTGSGTSQPAAENGAETDTPEAGAGSGEGQPAAENGTETDTPGTGADSGEGQPTAGNGQENGESQSGSSGGTSQPAAGSGPETGPAQDTGAAGSSQPDGGAGEPSGPEDTEETSAAQPRYYTVKPGDTLGSICISIYHDQSMMEKVCKANGIDNGDKIYVGQKLVLP